MARHPRQRSSTAAIAIGAFFFTNGAAYASWIPRLPEIRRELDVSDTALGLTLVGAGLGGLGVSLASGRIVDRVGSRAATVTTSIALSALLPVVAFAPTPIVLFVALLAIGAFDGLTDVAMNSQALQLQRRRSTSILTRMHAVWSIGTLTGGLVVTRAAAAGVDFRVQLVVTSLVLIVLTAVAARWLLESEHLDHAEASPAERVPLPARLFSFLFVIGVLAILAELPATEWASLLMAERFDMSVGSAATGFVGFAAGMVVGRLGGDTCVDRFGAEHTRRGGGLVAATGLIVATTGAEPWVSVIGFFVAGCGASTLFPLMIRGASVLVPGARGVAAASSGARLGILLGAPLMGAISDQTSRSTALAVVGVTAATLSAVLPFPRITTAPHPHRTSGVAG